MPVHADRLAECVRDALARIERGGRILEHDLQAAPQAPQLRRARRDHVQPVEAHLARIRGDEAQAGARDRRFAAARFADDAERLAALDGERDAVDRAHRHGLRHRPAALRLEGLGEVADDEQRRGGGARAHGALTQQRTRCSGAPGSGLSGGRSAHFSMRKGQRDW